MRALAEISRQLDDQARIREFCTLARILMLSRGRRTEAVRMAGQDEYAQGRVVQILRDASPGTTIGASPSGWGEELLNYQTLQSSFIASLVNASAFDRVASVSLVLPPRTRVIATTVAATGSKVAETGTKVVSQLDFSDDILDMLKAASLIAISEDMIRISNPAILDFLQAELTAAVALATDEIFVSQIAAGLTPQSSAGNLLGDIALALSDMTLTARSRLVGVISSDTAKQIATAEANGAAAFPNFSATTGGVVAGVDFAISDVADEASSPTSASLLIIDGSQLATNPGQIALGSSFEANINLGSGNVSLFQQNLRALKSERFFGFVATRSAGFAALVTGVDYAS